MRGPIVVVGEVIADLIDTSDGQVEGAIALTARPGGTPANVAVGLARLATDVEFVGRLSQAGLGPWLRQHLEVNGVGLRCSVRAGELPTIAHIGFDRDGVPLYDFYGPDTADWQWQAGELPDNADLETPAIHTGSLATVFGPGAKVIAEWVERMRSTGRILVSYDPNVRPSVVPDLETFVGDVETWVRRAHLVKVSEEDLGVLYPGRDPLALAVEWAATGPDLVVVTHGGQGATAVRSSGTTLRRQGPVVEVVDTVGAGDAFAVGLLAWLYAEEALVPGGPGALDDAALGAALDRANLVAAISCTRAGADPPWAAEVQAHLVP
jgi:fructokinase